MPQRMTISPPQQKEIFMTTKLRTCFSKSLLTLSMVASSVSLAHATDFTVEVENLTRGIYFTPLAVAAHPDGTSIFQVGDTASTEV